MKSEGKSPGIDPDLGPRLSELVRVLGGPVKAASLVGVTSEQVTRWIRGLAKPPFYALARLCAAAGISVDWLATGLGPINLDQTGLHPVTQSLKGVLRAHRERREASGEDMTGFVRVPRYDVRASAGPGALADEENIKDFLMFREEWIRKDLGTSPDEVLCMNTIGDSMEPTIRGGDVILIDQAITKIADEAIYVVAIDEALLLKRVQPLMGAVELRSDNPLYKPVTLSTADAERMRVLGRVRWIGRVV